MNGSFEVSENELPVNWLIYTPETTQEGDFDVYIDEEISRAGEKSLKFDIRNCSSAGGRKSPGITQEWDVLPGENYIIRFWMINEGTNFRASTGWVSAFEGKLEKIVSTDKDIPDWKLYEYRYSMPSDRDKIRFELSILSAGTVWIDEFSISKEVDL